MSNAADLSIQLHLTLKRYVRIQYFDFLIIRVRFGTLYGVVHTGQKTSPILILNTIYDKQTPGPNLHYLATAIYIRFQVTSDHQASTMPKGLGCDRVGVGVDQRRISPDNDLRMSRRDPLYRLHISLDIYIHS